MAQVALGNTGSGTGPVGSPVTLLSVDGEFRSFLINDTDSVITITHTFDPATGDDVVTEHKIPAKDYVVINNGAAGTVALSNAANSHGTSAQVDERIYLVVG